MFSLEEVDEDLNEFENDGFIVDDTEDGEEEEGESPTQTQKKRKRLLYIPTLLSNFIYLYSLVNTVSFCYTFSGNL